MTRLVFVEDPGRLPEPRPDTVVVVLDAAWTPTPDARRDVLPIRPVVAGVVESTDLVRGTLVALDAWAAATGMPDRLSTEGVSWWPQVRMLLRWDVHELFLWRHVIDRLSEGLDVEEVVVPAAWAALAGAVRAPRLASRTRPRARTQPSIRIVGVPGPASRAIAALHRVLRRRRPIARLVGLALLASRGVRHGIGLLRWLPQPAGRDERSHVLDSRFDAMRTRGGVVLTIAWPRAFQLVREAGRERRVDPHLSAATDRLAASGRPVAVVGLGLDHRRDGDWAAIAADPTLLPESFLTGRWIRPLDVLLDSTSVAAAVASSPRTALPVGDHDLGPALLRLVEQFTGAWLDWQRLRALSAERLLRDLRPGVLFTDREASRIAWLHAARRQTVPTVAIQHGMIYRMSPEYWRPAGVRPDVTCVFGTWERDLLVREAGYPATGVVVTGSPRGDQELATAEPGEREAVRRELGVAPADQLLVVSVAHNVLMGELHTFSALARVLGGPLPGIHLAIKLHPQDQAPPRHRDLLEGLARAGGYEAPPITIVRDIDLYRLLRSADAHLGQYSTVLTDAVAAGTPNMIIVGQGYEDVLGYVEAGVATAVRSHPDVRAFMADPKLPAGAARMRFLERHFLGGNAPERIANVLIEATDGHRGVPDSMPQVIRA